jgi:hypothetical protein
VHASQDFIEKVVFGGMFPKLSQGPEVSVVDGSVFIRREGDVGPDPGQVLVDCVLGLKDISREQSRR